MKEKVIQDDLNLKGRLTAFQLNVTNVYKEIY